MSGKPRVFISYARRDGEAFATQLRQRLETDEPEITVWQDRARMEGGRDWWGQITQALETAQFLVLVMTPAAMHSEMMRKEWRYARQHGVCVYPVKGVDDSLLDFAALPRWMRKAHFFDLEHEWQTFVNHLKGPCHATRVPFMAPDLPHCFVGRTALLHGLLGMVLDEKRENPIPTTIALRGAGGFGKTTLAAALCHHEDVITAFDDGILWVSLGTEPNVQDELSTIYAALTGERPNFINEKDASIHVAEKLQDLDCLVVIDDAWDLAHVRPFLQGGSECTRVITTRSLGVAAGFDRVIVDTMTPTESVDLLINRLGPRPVDLLPFRVLASQLGAWPLMIELAAGVLQERLVRQACHLGIERSLRPRLGCGNGGTDPCPRRPLRSGSWSGSDPGWAMCRLGLQRSLTAGVGPGDRTARPHHRRAHWRCECCCCHARCDASGFGFER